MTIAKYKDWMAKSAIDEKRELAIKARTSLSLLYQLGYETRTASPDLAARVARGIASINKRKRHVPLPEVAQGDLSPVCAKCKFYRECDS